MPPWVKPAVFVGSLVPLAVLLLEAATGRLGADPIAQALNELGLLALIFLIASLAATPINAWMRWSWLVRMRRMLGLFAFFYASLHVLTYVVLDQGLNLPMIVLDIVSRPFILAGFAAITLLVPLAWTSTNESVQRLGFKNWKRLHRLAYVAAILGVTHFWLRVKIDITEPVVYGSVLLLLLAARVWSPTWKRKARSV